MSREQPARALMVPNMKKRVISQVLFLAVWLCLSFSQQFFAAPATRISTHRGDSDYPSVCRAPDGAIWAVWQTYVHSEGRDLLYISKWQRNAWSDPVTVSHVSGDLFKPACAVDGEGKLWILWSQQVEKEWNLWATFWDGFEWSRPEEIGRNIGPDWAPRIAASPAGETVVVWQGWNQNNFDIFLSRLVAEKWQQPEVVTHNPFSDWMPDVALSDNGIITVVWDTYRNGSYDVYFRQKVKNRWLEETAIAAGTRFEGYSRIASGRDGILWIAYEERNQEWGKDRGDNITAEENEINTLLGFSRVKVRCIKNGRLLKPIQPPAQLPGQNEWGGDHSPSIAVTEEGLVWLAFRRPEVAWQKMFTFKRLIPTAVWKNYALYFDGNKWSDPISFEDLPSRGDSDLDIAVLPGDGLIGVFHSDDSKYPDKSVIKGFPKFTDNQIYGHVLAAPEVKPVSPRLGVSVAGISNYLLAAAQKERRDVEQARRYVATSGKDQYRLFRGDLHRHTFISADGCSDAAIIDLFRYGMDAASLDFIAVTDHNQFSGIDNDYVWWRTQKITDLFNIPPFFITLFGYERSINYPYGHRNVIEAERGFRALPHQGVKELSGDTKKLYDHVRKTGGVAIPHTTGSDHGTDWSEHDPEIETVVEIYQGCRSSYEHEGAPRSDLPGSQQSLESGYRSEGFVCNAWKKGYLLGVIASSDHQSTHISVANIWSKEATRQGLIDAIRQRHTFASTDNIVVDFHCANAMQGDTLLIKGKPRFQAVIVGTAPIENITLFKNFENTWQTKSARFSWIDQSPAANRNIYYIRVMQTDGQMAWSSPIWLTYQFK
jgi:hypothetical protein